jgi:hypothetical protein
MKWLALLICLLGSGASADALLRPQMRPVLAPALRPLARPDPSLPPNLAKALVAVPAVAHIALTPQEARLDALTQLPPAIPPVILVSFWQAAPPMFRPEGDFGGDLAGVETVSPSVLRPVQRPDAVSAPVVLASAAAVMRPQLRPGDLIPEVMTDATPTFDAALSLPAAPSLSSLAIPVALRPEDRPAGIVQQAEAARVARVRGSVCGNPQIQGEDLGHVPGPGACGIDNAVLVRSVDGVRLSTAGTMDCATAEALQDWVHTVAKPELASSGGGLTGLQIMGTYACRNRNNAASGRLSEHAHGKAVDIGGFTLADGGTITVLNGWGTNSYGTLLRHLHDGACGIFGTILGPEANAYHRNHFHFDTASYRSGSYCQ